MRLGLLLLLASYSSFCGAVNRCGEILVENARSRSWLMAELPYFLDGFRFESTRDGQMWVSRFDSGKPNHVVVQKWDLSRPQGAQFPNTRTFVPWDDSKAEVSFFRSQPTVSPDGRWQISLWQHPVSETFALHAVGQEPSADQLMQFELFSDWSELQAEENDSVAESLYARLPWKPEGGWVRRLPMRDSSDFIRLDFSPDSRHILGWSEYGFELKSVHSRRTLFRARHDRQEVFYCAWLSQDSFLVISSQGLVQTYHSDGKLISETYIASWEGSALGQTAQVVHWEEHPFLLTSRGHRVAGGPGHTVPAPEYLVLDASTLVELGRLEAELPFGYTVQNHQILPSGVIVVSAVPFYADNEYDGRAFVLNGRTMWETGDWKVSFPDDKSDN